MTDAPASSTPLEMLFAKIRENRAGMDAANSDRDALVSRLQGIAYEREKLSKVLELVIVEGIDPLIAMMMDDGTLGLGLPPQTVFGAGQPAASPYRNFTVGEMVELAMCVWRHKPTLWQRLRNFLGG